jgi:hypothetical protein
LIGVKKMSEHKRHRTLPFVEIMKGIGCLPALAGGGFSGISEKPGAF